MRALCLPIVLLLLGGAACASVKPMPIELAEARRDYQQTEASEAPKYAPAELHAAKVALDQANKLFAEDPESPRVRDLGYVAQRKAAVARSQARIYAAGRAREAAEKSLRESETQELMAARAELNRLRDMLSKANTDAEYTKQRLEALTDNQVKSDERGTIITLSGQVLFEQGKSELLPGAKTQLDQIARVLRDAKTQSLVIEGYTDATGSPQRNAQVSQARAEAVLAYLSSQGVSAAQMSAVGRGESNPVANNDTAEGRATNRRVEIVVQGQSSAER